MSDEFEINFSVLMGKVLKTITFDKTDAPRIIFECDDGDCYLMYHQQNCCESVFVESIVGDLDDLIGSEILLAEEATNDSEANVFDPMEPKPEFEAESYTWTFYKLRTLKGSVDIRWYGSSNGYYSERVSFVKT